MLRIEDLSIGYKQKAICSNLSFHAKTGQLIAVTGRNGSGKTTFLKTLAGLLPAIGGKVLWEDKDLLNASVREKAKVISLVQTKSPEWTGLTVEEVIALGAYPAPLNPNDKKVKDQLTLFDLTKIKDQRLDSISDGERQKTMIARALIQDTPLMIMDEPTSFLDYKSKVEWWALLSKLKDQGKIIVVSSHDLDLLKKQPIDQYWEF